MLLFFSLKFTSFIGNFRYSVLGNYFLKQNLLFPPRKALLVSALGFGFTLALCFIVSFFFFLKLNVVNSVSISEDIKPLPGLPGIGNMNYPSTSPGSLVKHICAICGDRSSGMYRGRHPSQMPYATGVPEKTPVLLPTWLPCTQWEKKESLRMIQAGAQAVDFCHHSLDEFKA